RTSWKSRQLLKSLSLWKLQKSTPTTISGIWISWAFSGLISRPAQRAILLNKLRWSKNYSIMAMPTRPKAMSILMSILMNIIEQIDMVKTLLDNSYAYETNGNVYFDLSSDEDYGKLSGRSVEDQESGTRIDTASDKQAPEDFALWKKADEGHIMKWPPPWCVGYPGWHIECSAMSTKYLGENFDIHAGGLD